MVMLHLDDLASDALQQSPCPVKGFKPPSEMAGIVIGDRYRITLRGGKGKMPIKIREDAFRRQGPWDAS